MGGSCIALLSQPSLQGPILSLYIPMTNPWSDSWQQIQKVLYLL